MDRNNATRNKLRAHTMDPNATLAQLLDALCVPRTATGSPSSYDRLRDIQESSRALVFWIKNGGFLPSDPREAK